MKNWSTKLVLALVATVIVTLLLAYILNKFGVETIFTSIIGGILIFGAILWKLKTLNKANYGFVIGIIAAAVCFVGSQWLFNSANTTVRFTNLDQYLAAAEKPLYFTLDAYSVDFDGTGDAEITTTRTRRGISSESVDHYIVTPIYIDTTAVDVKAWITNAYSKERYDAADNYEELLDMDNILYFETLSGDHGDFETAIGYSDYKELATPNAALMYARYIPYITKTTWGIYFLITLIVGCALVALCGVFIGRYKLKKQAELEAEAKTE